jgi:FkbM family methyltransferase
MFVVVSTDHGTMLVNRMDALEQTTPDGQSGACGVGIEILEEGSYQPNEGDLLLGILELKRQYAGDGVLAIDGGANIGVFTVDWARAMTNWGRVVAFEPQERIYYALAGNITMNNCFNAAAVHAALGNHDGTIPMPVPDYSIYSNFGGLSLNGSNENFGQEIKDYANVRCLRIDSLNLERCDLIKLDIEGMELDALQGAEATIELHRPVIVAEHTTSGIDPLVALLEPKGYRPFGFGINLVFVHRLDKVLDHVQHLHKSLVRSAVADAEITEALA